MFGNEAGPFYELTDIWLPRILVLVFYAPVVVLQIISAFQGSGWVPPVSLLLIALEIFLLITLVLPLAAVGLRIAGNLMNFTLYDDGRFKILAAYAPVPAAIVLAILIFVGSAAIAFPQHGMPNPAVVIVPFLLALLAGISVSFFLMWFMFQLRFLEALVSWIFTTLLYFVGSMAAGGAMFIVALGIGWLIALGSGSHTPSKQQTALNQDAGDSTPQPQLAPRVTPLTPPPKILPPQEQLPQDARPLHDASADNLANLFAALQKYASTDPQGHFPDKMDDLVASGLIPAEAIRSPFDPSQQYLFFPRHGQEKVNFAVLAYDPAELSRYGVTLVLNGAGNVTATTRLGLDDFLHASERALAQAPIETRTPKIASNMPGRSSQVTPHVPKPVEPPASREFLDTFAANKSPLVAEIREIDAGTGIRQILHPLSTSAFTAIVKTDDTNQDVIQIWDLVAGQKQAEATFARDAGAPGEYAINSTGTLLAHVAKWPRLSLRIWSFKDQKETRAIPLNPAFGTAVVHGFLTPEKVAVRWSNRGLDGLEIWDANTGAHGKQVTFDVFKRSPSNGVITPDGKLFALTNQQQRTNRPIFELYDLSGPMGGYHWYPISDMDGRVAQTPVGLAFSPDNKKLAALFEQAGAGIIYCWRVADGKQLGEYPVTITTHPAPSPDGARGLDWIADGSAWLIMGDLLVDSTTGRQLGNLNAPPATDQWMADPATLVLRYDAGKDQPRVACVRIDTSQLTQPTTAPVK